MSDGGMPPLLLEFDLDDKGSLKVKRIEGTLTKLGGSMDKVSTHGEKMQGKLDRIFNKLGRVKGMVIGLTSVFGGLSAAMALRNGIRDAVEFQSALIDMGRVTDRSFTDIREDIMGLDSSLGKPTELMRAYYQAISAGAKEGAEALTLVETSSMAATSAHIDQGETIKALTKMMTGFAGEIKSAAEASDLLFTIEKKGQTSFAELAPIIGDVAAQSHQMAINANEMGGALAVISQTAGSTAQASTQYAALLTALTKPRPELLKLIEDAGYANAESIIAAKGFIPTIQMLVNQTDKSSIALGKLFTMVEGRKGLVGLMRNDFEDANVAIAAMEGKAGATDRAFANFQSTLEGRWGTISAKISKVAIQFMLLGQTSFEGLLDSVDGVVDGISKWVRNNKELIQSGFETVVGGISTAIEFLADNWGLLVVAGKAFIAMKMASVFSGIAVSAETLSVVMGKLKKLNPWVLIIGGAIALHGVLHKMGQKYEGLGRYMIEFDAIAQKAFEMSRYGWESIWIAAKKMMDMVRSAWIETVNLLVSSWNEMMGVIGRFTGVDLTIALKLGENKGFNWMKAQLEAERDHKKRMEEITQDAQKKQEQLTEHFYGKVEDLAGEAHKTIEGMEKTHQDNVTNIITDGMDDQLDVVDEHLEELKRLAESLTLQYDPKAALDARKAQLEQIKGLVSAEVYQRALTEATKEYESAVRDVMLAEGGWREGAIVAMKDYADTSAQSAQHMYDAFTTAFDGVKETALDVFTGVEMDVERLANTIHRELMRALVVEPMMNRLSGFGAGIAGSIGGGSGLIGGLFGFRHGGIMTATGPIPLRSYDTGGIADSPQAAIFAEGDRPEAYVPLDNGKSIPVTVKAKSGEGSTSSRIEVGSLQINVHGVTDAKSFRANDTQIARGFLRTLSRVGAEQ